MLNGESWLAHSDLFTKHWIVETKPWVRSLGWFTDFEQTVRDSNGWAQAGEKELTIYEYINVLEEKGSERKIYQHSNGKWQHISAPLVFVVRKNDELVFIAGWAGEPKTIREYQASSVDPWDWPEKIIVDVNPLAAIHTLKFDRSKNSEIPVFFASNGETNAEENWEHLVKMCPRAVRIEGINGRRKMFLRCVDLSEGASHFFVVTGKNKVTDKTIFDYPVKDAPRAHIVFNAKNMSNRLEYGHMGIVAYNVDLVLSTPENFGLDFTSYSPIHTVPRTVSEATFATSSFEAWRTAFRETVKLTLRNSINDQHWLARWLAFAEGYNSNWVLTGAKDGHEYALQFKDSPEELRKTVDWNWLEEHYTSLHT
jgi:hypothetical protein